MKLRSAYANIISALGDAQRYAGAIDDAELKASIRKIEVMAIDRLYSITDREAEISVMTPKDGRLSRRYSGPARQRQARNP